MTAARRLASGQSTVDLGLETVALVGYCCWDFKTHARYRQPFLDLLFKLHY
jgi:hypothetical protein